MIKIPYEEIKENAIRFPNLKSYEIECRLILEKIVEDDPVHPYKNKYRAYVRTMHWRALKSRKLTSVERKCEVCGIKKDIDIHHINYKNLYDVELNDLKAVCGSCHKKEHR